MNEDCYFHHPTSTIFYRINSNAQEGDLLSSGHIIKQFDIRELPSGIFLLKVSLNGILMKVVKVVKK